jgi:hypothetical protein
MVVRSSFGLCMLVSAVTLCSVVAAAAAVVEKNEVLNHDYDEEILKHLELFHYSEEAAVLGPSSFPRPTDLKALDGDIVPYLKPVHGKHRPDQDAVVAFAAEYPLSSYLSFIESLRATGFEGDIVLAISPLDMRKDDVWEYLSEPDNHIVLYAPLLVCYNAENEAVESAKGGSRTCLNDGLYARKTATGKLEPLVDPRPPRTVQTLRYEIYWLMCLSMSPHSWILLVDARDTYFQSNPFATVPRATDSSEASGVLYFFGENVEATRLGKSKSNSKWLQAAYGEYVSNLLADKPTVCSGATMGESVALETYIRAMVAESDYTGTVLAGADQGFHNFLHYSHKFKNTETIHSIVVFDQGQGIVNNMGALRTKPLEEWGNGKILKSIVNEEETNPRKKTAYTVLNWDGAVSPVVHQFDRHKQLSEYFFKIKGGEFMDKWHQRKKKTLLRKETIA